MQTLRSFLLAVCVVGCAALAFAVRPQPERYSDAGVKMPRVERKAAREAYFQRLLRDPSTGQIPRGIRQDELRHAAGLPDGSGLGKNASAAYDWTEYGPNDIGGRTRALAVDVGNPATILAGGVSGGIWKSTDRGATWRQVSSPGDALAVTSLAQDTRPGHRNTWYAVTGEYSGNSASSRDFEARNYGTGLFVSTDNGETWTRRFDAGNNTRFDSSFDYAMRIAVNPSTGTVFVCSNAFGILRSNADVTAFSYSLGGLNQHTYCDVAAAPDGSVVAAVGSGFEAPSNTPGLYRSTDDGVTWTRFGAGTIPTDFNRPVVAVAPSNPNRAYLLLVASSGAPRLFTVDFASGATAERTASLPNFGGDTGTLDTQGNYNLTLVVKPDDPDFVLIGGTSLYRTRDGFASPIDDRRDWINGYTNLVDPPLGAFQQYAKGHPDQHVAAFDPSDPNRMYVGNDGGIQRADDIRVQAQTFPWISLNNFYNVTQFYRVALPPQAGAQGALGGTQDNGSPLVANATDLASLADLSSGDGSYAHWGNALVYASSQNGRLAQWRLNAQLDLMGVAFNLEPAAADEQQFIHPFAVDPADDRVVYYPDGTEIFRNTNLTDGSGWAQLSAAASDLYNEEITALKVAGDGSLYYGISSQVSGSPSGDGCFQNNVGSCPQIVRVPNARTAATLSSADYVTLPGSDLGAFLADIAVNPVDADEVIAVVSNYNTESLFRSAQGGAEGTWEAVEGNLAGTDELPGPSVRAATIVPQADGSTVYFAATSTGLYATDALAGANTVWTRQSPDGIGATVVSHVTSRPSDGRVLAGTHGRGLFAGSPGTATSTQAERVASTLSLAALPSVASDRSVLRFSLPAPADVTLRLYDATGRAVRTLLSGEWRRAGEQDAAVTLSDLASGVYFARLEARIGGAPVVRTQRVVVAR